MMVVVGCDQNLRRSYLAFFCLGGGLLLVLRFCLPYSDSKHLINISIKNKLILYLNVMSELALSTRLKRQLKTDQEIKN